MNFYYEVGQTPPPNVCATIMELLNSISELFDMNDPLTSALNSFIKSHSNGIPPFEQHRRLIALELEMSRQCTWWFCFNKFKTPHSVERISTYVPNAFVESDVNSFELTKATLTYFNHINKNLDENLSKNT
jgi:hypothetical protein